MIAKQTDIIYYVYKINLLMGNLAGSYYIGQHRTNNINDGYCGSGTILRNYFKSHGAIEGETYTKEILQYCNSIQELNEAEKKFISDKYDTDPNCINLIAGGGGKWVSENTRKKISESNIGREITEEARKRISKKLMGHEVSEETKEIIRQKILELYRNNPEYRIKNSEAQKRRKPITEETRRKIAEASRGREGCWRGKKMPKSITEKMSDSQKGRVTINNGVELKRVKPCDLEEYLSKGWVLGMREEDKKKASERQKGKEMTEETKKRLSEAFKGRKMSEEARAKIAANNRARANDPVIRKKISDAKKGKHHTPEHIAKVAAAKRGIPQSAESNLKRSETMKRKHWYFDKQLNKRIYYDVLQSN